MPTKTQQPRVHPQGSALAKRTMRKEKKPDFLIDEGLRRHPNIASGRTDMGKLYESLCLPDKEVAKYMSYIPENVRAGVTAEQIYETLPSGRREREEKEAAERKKLEAEIEKREEKEAKRAINEAAKIKKREEKDAAMIKKQEPVVASAEAKALAAAAGRAAMTAATERGTNSQRPALRVQTGFTGEPTTTKYISKGTLRATTPEQPDGILAAWNRIKIGGHLKERARLAEQERVEAEQKQALGADDGYASAYPERLDSLGSDYYGGADTPTSATSNTSGSSFGSWMRKTVSRRNSNASVDSKGSTSSLKSLLGSAKKAWGYFKELDAKDEEARKERKRQNMKATISYPKPDEMTSNAAQKYPDVRAEQALRSASQQRVQVLKNSQRGTTVGDLMNTKTTPVKDRRPGHLSAVIGKLPKLRRSSNDSDATFHCAGVDECQLQALAEQSERKKAAYSGEGEFHVDRTHTDRSKPLPPVKRVASSVYSDHPAFARHGSYSSIEGNPYLDPIRESQYADGDFERHFGF